MKETGQAMSDRGAVRAVPSSNVATARRPVASKADSLSTGQDVKGHWERSQVAAGSPTELYCFATSTHFDMILQSN